MQKGVLILSEARSGTYWLCSLLAHSRTMGQPEEWLDPWNLGETITDGERLFQRVVERASTDNGRFAVKLFPRHVTRFNSMFNVDFIDLCRQQHDVGLLRLSRRDRLRQAISLARSNVTNQWKSTDPKQGEERYDFGAICTALFHVEQSEAFWNAYLDVKQAPYDHFHYEDLVDDPRPFVETAAGHLEVESPLQLHSALSIQRDATTLEWVERFRNDAQRHNALEHTPLAEPSARTFRNLFRFLRKRPMA